MLVSSLSHICSSLSTSHSATHPGLSKQGHRYLISIQHSPDAEKKHRPIGSMCPLSVLVKATPWQCLEFGIFEMSLSSKIQLSHFVSYCNIKALGITVMRKSLFFCESHTSWCGLLNYSFGLDFFPLKENLAVSVWQLYQFTLLSVCVCTHECTCYTQMLPAVADTFLFASNFQSECFQRFQLGEYFPWQCFLDCSSV